MLLLHAASYRKSKQISDFFIQELRNSRADQQIDVREVSLFDTDLPAFGTQAAAAQEPCPIKQTLNLLGNKWIIPRIIKILRERPGSRSSELLRNLPSLLQKVLTRAMGLLLEVGYVTRVDYETWPKKS